MELEAKLRLLEAMLSECQATLKECQVVAQDLLIRPLPHEKRNQTTEPNEAPQTAKPVSEPITSKPKTGAELIVALKIDPKAKIKPTGGWIAAYLLNWGPCLKSEVISIFAEGMKPGYKSYGRALGSLSRCIVTLTHCLPIPICWPKFFHCPLCALRHW